MSHEGIGYDSMPGYMAVIRPHRAAEETHPWCIPGRGLFARELDDGGPGRYKYHGYSLCRWAAGSSGFA